MTEPKFLFPFNFYPLSYNCQKKTVAKIDWKNKMSKACPISPKKYNLNSPHFWRDNETFLAAFYGVSQGFIFGYNTISCRIKLIDCISVEFC